MPRSIWKGTISFGLVTIPVSLYTAENRRTISFNMLDGRDMSRIQQRRVNANTGEEVPWEEIVKGYEYEKGEYVVMSEEELKAASPEATQTVNIIAVVKADEIPHMYFETPYYLEPSKQGRKAYALLREILSKNNYVGIGKVVIRTREYLAAVIPQDQLLLLDLMRYPSELRDADELDLPGEDLKKLGIDKRELDMAQRLVEAMEAPFNPEEYTDTFHDAVMELIERKAETGTIGVATPSEEPKQPKVVDIMSLLKRSLENVEKRGAESEKKKRPKPVAVASRKRERARKKAS